MSQRKIEYEQVAIGGMTPRQGKWLIVLLLLNTMLLAVGVAGPQLGPAVRGGINDWLARRAAARSEQQAAAARAQSHQQLLADQAQWMKFDFAPDTTMLEEDPKIAAANLISGKGYRAVTTRDIPYMTPAWQPPVVAPVPPAVAQLISFAFSANEAVLFVHERRTPGGEAKLVCIACDAVHTAAQIVATNDRRVSVQATLTAYAYDPIPANDDATDLQHIHRWKEQELALTVPRGAGSVIRFVPNRGNNSYDVVPGAYLRLMGGAADPGDPTHFTIPYKLGATSGTIDGWLRDDAIELRGHEGEIGPQSSWLLPLPKQ